MRKVTYGAAVSLDGHIAGPGEAMDWLLWSDDARKISSESWKGVDTILTGRKTYKFAARPIARDCVLMRYKVSGRDGRSG